ncbi:MAG: hypothetical protein WBB18_06320 [Nodosilinea sp.]
MGTEEFILEVTKLMTTVLTGFLVILANAVGRIWSSRSALKKSDYIGVAVISLSGLLSFGCWAGALAGAMIYTTGKGGTILFKTLPDAEKALAASQSYVGLAYSLFVFTVIASGVYYLFLLRTVNVR